MEDQRTGRCVSSQALRPRRLRSCHNRDEFVTSFGKICWIVPRCCAAAALPSRSGPIAQQPRQIFRSRAFIRASSALMVSTYFPSSDFDTGRLAGTAAIGFVTPDLDTGEALS